MKLKLFDFSLKRFLLNFRIPLYFLALIWIIHLLQFIGGWDWSNFGLFPRRTWGLTGILTSPLIHADFAHISSNTLSLFILSLFVYHFYRSVAVKATVLIYLFSGIFLWLFGRPVYHIGASGLIYGFVSFIFWNGIFRRNIRSIALSLFVLFQFNGMFLGIFPVENGISWDGHLFGAFAGILISYYLKDELEPEENTRNSPSFQTEDPRQTYFLDPDTFAKTKAEREKEKNKDSDSLGNFWYSNRT